MVWKTLRFVSCTCLFLSCSFWNKQKKHWIQHRIRFFFSLGKSLTRNHFEITMKVLRVLIFPPLTTKKTFFRLNFYAVFKNSGMKSHESLRLIMTSKYSDSQFIWNNFFPLEKYSYKRINIKFYLRQLEVKKKIVSNLKYVNFCRIAN